METMPWRNQHLYCIQCPPVCQRENVESGYII
nr:MAG TPA: hypothetical protein [Bacteriophage sp.]